MKDEEGFHSRGGPFPHFFFQGGRDGGGNQEWVFLRNLGWIWGMGMGMGMACMYTLTWKKMLEWNIQGEGGIGEGGRGGSVVRRIR